MKIKLFQRKKEFKKGGFHINPDVCWEVVVVVAFTLTIASFVFGFYIFKQTNEDLVSSGDVVSGQTMITKKERIDKVLEYFSGRAEKSAETLKSPSSVVDPSL